MSRTAILNALRVVTALAVMLSAVPFLREGSMYHDAGHSYAVQTPDLAQGTLRGHTHSHSHDDNEDDGTALPSHGHEYTDHSHVTFGLPAPPFTSLPAPEGRLVRARENCPAVAGPPFHLDRPPCLLSFA